MALIIKRVILENMERWKKQATINLFEDVASLQMEIIMNCCFGAHHCNPLVEQMVGGKKV